MEMDKKLKILSIGAGAIGTYIGGSLASVGNQVVFVDQPSMVERLTNQGIRLDLSKNPDMESQKLVHLRRPDVEFSPSLSHALKGRKFDLAIFALKSFDTQSALEGMKDSLADLPPILCLQNGVDNEKIIANYVGEDNVIPGTVTSAIGRLDVGNIVLEKLRGVGLFAGHPISTLLFEQMRRADLRPMLFQKPLDMKWSKMLTNLIANASSAILDLSPAEIFSNKRLTKMEIQQIRECLRVMDALGLKAIDLPGTPVAALVLSTSFPLWLTQPLFKKILGGGRGGKMPSFHIDLSSGRGKSEVSFLNGAVVREGKRMNIPTPVNAFLEKTLMRMTINELPRATYALNWQGFLKDLNESEN